MGLVSSSSRRVIESEQQRRKQRLKSDCFRIVVGSWYNRNSIRDLAAKSSWKISLNMFTSGEQYDDMQREMVNILNNNRNFVGKAVAKLMIDLKKKMLTSHTLAIAFEHAQVYEEVMKEIFILFLDDSTKGVFDTLVENEGGSDMFFASIISEYIRSYNNNDGRIYEALLTASKIKLPEEVVVSYPSYSAPPSSTEDNENLSCTPTEWRSFTEEVDVSIEERVEKTEGSIVRPELVSCDHELLQYLAEIKQSCSPYRMMKIMHDLSKKLVQSDNERQESLISMYAILLRLDIKKSNTNWSDIMDYIHNTGDAIYVNDRKYGRYLASFRSAVITAVNPKVVTESDDKVDVYYNLYEFINFRGTYHSEIEVVPHSSGVKPEEFCFCEDGIQTHSPGDVVLCFPKPVRTTLMGSATRKCIEKAKQYLQTYKNFVKDSYHLTSKNCNNFAMEYIKYILPKSYSRIPYWTNFSAIVMNVVLAPIPGWALIKSSAANEFMSDDHIFDPSLNPILE